MKKTILPILILLLIIPAACSALKGDKTVVSPAETDVMNRVTAAESTSARAATAEQTSTELFEGARQEKDGDSPTVASSGLVRPKSTFTGLPPMSPVTFEVHDPNNARGLKTARIDYGFGVAKNGKPNEISVSNQAAFDSSGTGAICLDTRSNGMPVYLTFDCGYENGLTASILDTLKEKGVPAAFFCTLSHIKDSPELIARMIKEGHTVGNHSSTHADFSKLSRAEMVREILDCDNYLRLNFGYTSPYFRFPEGAYSENSLELVADLGYTSVFWSAAYEDWDTSKPHGAEYAVKTVTDRLHPGAVILLHAVSEDNAAAMGEIIDKTREMGYVFKPLSDLPAR